MMMIPKMEVLRKTRIDEGPQELDLDDEEEEEDMASDPEIASIIGGNRLPLFWFICFYAMILRCTTVEENIGKVRSVLIGIPSIAMFYANPEAGKDLSKPTCAFRSKSQFDLHAHLKHRVEVVTLFLFISLGHGLIPCVMFCKG